MLLDFFRIVRYTSSLLEQYMTDKENISPIPDFQRNDYFGADYQPQNTYATTSDLEEMFIEHFAAKIAEKNKENSKEQNLKLAEIEFHDDMLRVLQDVAVTKLFPVPMRQVH